MSDDTVTRLRAAGALVKRLEMKGAAKPIANAAALSRAEQDIHDAADTIEALRAQLAEAMTILKFLACVDVNYATEHDELLVEDAVRDAKAFIDKSSQSPNGEARSSVGKG